jgi:hypothetical protein
MGGEQSIYGNACSIDWVVVSSKPYRRAMYPTLRSDLQRRTANHALVVFRKASQDVQVAGVLDLEKAVCPANTEQRCTVSTRSNSIQTIHS